jgi:hypothetical protein
MVNVLAIGPSVHESTSGRSEVFLMAIKMHSTPPFGEEVNPLAQCSKIVRHVITSKYEQRYFEE